MIMISKYLEEARIAAQLERDAIARGEAKWYLQQTRWTRFRAYLRGKRPAPDFIIDPRSLKLRSRHWWE